jgi:small GTP-binding protein
MGSSFNKFASYFSKQDEVRVLLFGLDAAGKTTILYVLKLGKVVKRIPTIGFAVETITSGNLNTTAFDVGGRDKIRPLWRHYYTNTSAIVFVVDSNDRERLDNASEQLHQIANKEELKNLPILIFANKQDLPNALTLDEIKEKLNLSKLDQMKTKWHLQPATATKNEGLHEGFQWLANTLKPKTDLTQPIIETINDSKIMKNDLLSVWNSINFKTLSSKFI